MRAAVIELSVGREARFFEDIVVIVGGRVGINVGVVGYWYFTRWMRFREKL